MLVAALRLTSPRFDTGWQAVLNIIGIALWLAIIVSLVVVDAVMADG